MNCALWPPLCLCPLCWGVLYEVQMRPWVCLEQGEQGGHWWAGSDCCTSGPQSTSSSVWWHPPCLYEIRRTFINLPNGLLEGWGGGGGTINSLSVHCWRTRLLWVLITSQRGRMTTTRLWGKRGSPMMGRKVHAGGILGEDSLSCFLSIHDQSDWLKSEWTEGSRISTTWVLFEALCFVKKQFSFCSYVYAYNWKLKEKVQLQFFVPVQTNSAIFLREERYLFFYYVMENFSFLFNFCTGIYIYFFFVECLSLNSLKFPVLSDEN